MARILMTLLGLALLALGVWLIVIWWSMVALVLLACVAVGAALVGVVVTIFGISEIAGALARPAAPPPHDADSPAE